MHACKRTTKVGLLMTALAVTMFATVAQAETSDQEVKQLREEVRQMRAQMQRIAAQQSDSWLTKRRAQEVRTLIHEVLSDADTRASLAEGGMTAGHNKNFFLASEDGKFLMKVAGQIQFRFIANFEQSDSDQEDSGFQVRRTKIGFSGHVDAGRKWDYKIVLATERDDGNVVMEDVIIGTKLSDSLYVRFGKYKIGFLWEEITSSSRLNFSDRGIVTEFFTTDRAEQVELMYKGDKIRGSIAINDGADSEFTTIGADAVEFAISGRVDVLIAGNWKQFKDFAKWSSDPTGLRIGGAIFYQAGDSVNPAASSSSTSDYFGWTVDGSYETGPLNIFVAVIGGHFDPDAGSGDRDMYGVVVQGGVMIIPDKLELILRLEWLDDDDVADSTDDLFAVTFGANYYFKKHNAKVTVDVVWIADGDMPSSNAHGNSAFSDGLGFSSGDTQEEDTFILRIQFQLLF